MRSGAQVGSARKRILQVDRLRSPAVDTPMGEGTYLNIRAPRPSPKNLTQNHFALHLHTLQGATKVNLPI